MTIKDLGERGFIDNLTSIFSGAPFSNTFLEFDCQGIGDDCAVISMDHTRAMVVTTDMLVEDVHFLRNAISAKELGHKSLAVNLSDVAAMGARPFASFMSISLPKDIDQSWINDFIDGYKELSAQHNVLLLGGDTVAGDKIAINITAMGQIDKNNIKYRTKATATDCILVTGELGSSAAGLKILLEQMDSKNQWSEQQRALVDKHHRPQPQVNEGEWLGRSNAVNAMLDISDGLLSDIKHITKDFGAEIIASQVPTCVDTITAIGGGEDYQLLLCVERDECQQLMQDYETHFGKPLYLIGNMTTEKGVKWVGLDETETKLLKTFSHF